MSMLTDIDHFVMVHRTTDLGLIRDQANPISKAKVGASLLQVVFQFNMHINIDRVLWTSKTL